VSKLKNEATDAAISAGAKGIAVLWQYWMDSIAKRRPNGLVARFRRRFGKLDPQRVEETAEDYVKRVAEEAKHRRR
jgi:hypothetical protein